jgi:hypothetical protein
MDTDKARFLVFLRDPRAFEVTVPELKEYREGTKDAKNTRSLNAECKSTRRLRSRTTRLNAKAFSYPCPSDFSSVAKNAFLRFCVIL